MFALKSDPRSKWGNLAQWTELYLAILNGDAKKSHVAMQTALAVGVLPIDPITECMVPAMDEVGKLLGGRILRPSVSAYGPRDDRRNGVASAASPVAPGQKLAVKGDIGKVKGDLHDIGKGIVGSMLEGSDFEISILVPIFRRGGLWLR